MAHFCTNFHHRPVAIFGTPKTGQHLPVGELVATWVLVIVFPILLWETVT